MHARDMPAAPRPHARATQASGYWAVVLHILALAVILVVLPENGWPGQRLGDIPIQSLAKSPQLEFPRPDVVLRLEVWNCLDKRHTVPHCDNGLIEGHLVLPRPLHLGFGAEVRLQDLPLGRLPLLHFEGESGVDALVELRVLRIDQPWHPPIHVIEACLLCHGECAPDLVAVLAVRQDVQVPQEPVVPLHCHAQALVDLLCCHSIWHAGRRRATRNARGRRNLRRDLWAA
mmetsp:Transcript_27985/g.88510  ORF Transcript_27985/g.88510 Transcript_27985/m.88510 type:complete len:231 (-) Transcript_27985:56-748(-)